MLDARALISTTLVLLGACVEHPAEGWKVLGPDQELRRGCEHWGYVMHDLGGTLTITADPGELLGGEIRVNSLVPYRDG